MMLAVVLMIVMTHATVRGACAEGFAEHDESSSHTEEEHHSPADDDGDCGEAPGSSCCKCPCHVIKIVLPRTTLPVAVRDLHVRVRLPYADPDRDTPVFDIFQPPKLSA